MGSVKYISKILGLIIAISSNLACNQDSKPLPMTNNKVTWFSIPADDLNRSTKFYQSAFGWKIEPLTVEKNDDFSFHVVVNSEGDSNYIPDQRGVVNGCIVKRKIGLPSPAVLIEVDNLDAAIEKVKQAGGTVVSDKIPMASLNGEFIFIKDPDGNYVELFHNLGGD